MQIQVKLDSERIATFLGLCKGFTLQDTKNPL